MNQEWQEQVNEQARLYRFQRENPKAAFESGMGCFHPDWENISQFECRCKICGTTGRNVGGRFIPHNSFA